MRTNFEMPNPESIMDEILILRGCEIYKAVTDDPKLEDEISFSMIHPFMFKKAGRIATEVDRLRICIFSDNTESSNYKESFTYDDLHVVFDIYNSGTQIHYILERKVGDSKLFQDLLSYRQAVITYNVSQRAIKMHTIKQLHYEIKQNIGKNQ